MFDITQDFAGTTIALETVACYVSGTLIRTERGEIPAEALAIGDRVITMSGDMRPIKWIGRRSYSGRFVMARKDILPVCFKAGSLADHVPARDLWISPHHAMYFRDDREGGLLIEARDLVNSVSVVQAGQADRIDYIHIELDSHDVIVAEGTLSETFVDDDSRWMFQNAPEYAGLYGDDINPLAVYCAPRRRDGFMVEAVRRRIDARAGLLGANGSCTQPLRGYVDSVGPHCISGWAQNPDHPEAPVCLDIVIDGRLIGQALANVYRQDLKAAGLGSGCHAFVFAPPPGTAIGTKRVEVLRSLDGAVLQQSAHAQGHAA